MKNNKHQKLVEDLLELAGIKANGSNPWDIQVNDDRFFRMWKYFLLSSAGSFRARKNQLWQIVLSKNGILGGYKSIR